MALSPFREIRHLDDLAQRLGCESKIIRTFVDAESQLEFYDELRIPKRRRGGMFRTVYRVNEAQLMQMHKTIAGTVSSVAVFPECVHGFVRRRSIVTNAKKHLGQRLLLHADIKNFFESITLDQVCSAFVSLGCRSEVAWILGRLCTLNGFLPQGVHSSPVLSNLVCRYLDADLMQLAAAHGCVYTRYADDITLSGDMIPEPSNVENILHSHGFHLRDGKCRIQRRGYSQFVTGLSVADPQRPRCSRKEKKRLRLILHYASRYGLEGHLREARGHRNTDPDTLYWKLTGKLRFMRYVEPQVAERMELLLEEARSKDSEEVSS